MIYDIKTISVAGCVCIDDDGAACAASNECFPGFAGTGAATCTSSKCECPTISGTKLIWKAVHAGFDRRVSICMNPCKKRTSYIYIYIVKNRLSNEYPVMLYITPRA